MSGILSAHRFAGLLTLGIVCTAWPSYAQWVSSEKPTSAPPSTAKPVAATKLVTMANGSKYVGVIEAISNRETFRIKTQLGERRLRWLELVSIDQVPAEPLARMRMLDRVVLLQSGASYRGELFSVTAEPDDASGISLLLATGEIRHFPDSELNRIQTMDDVATASKSLLITHARALLKDGRIMAGDLVEWVPGERLIIKLATGELRKVAVSELEAIDAGLLQAPPLSPSLSQQKQRTAQTEDTRQVYLVTTHDVTLQMEKPNFKRRTVDLMNVMYDDTEDTSDGWQAVCQPPCGRWLPRDARYRIRSKTFRGVEPFKLKSELGLQIALNYQLKPGRRWARILGGVFLGVSGLAVPLGAGFIAVNRPIAGYSQSATSQRLSDAGLTLLVTGLASLVAGAILLPINYDRVSFAQTAGVRSRELTPAEMATTPTK